MQFPLLQTVVYFAAEENLAAGLLHQGWTNLGGKVAVEIKFCAVAPHTYGPHEGTCFLSLLRRLEFWVGNWVFWKILHPYIIVSVTLNWVRFNSH